VLHFLFTFFEQITRPTKKMALVVATISLRIRSNRGHTGRPERGQWQQLCRRSANAGELFLSGDEAGVDSDVFEERAFDFKLVRAFQSCEQADVAVRSSRRIARESEKRVVDARGDGRGGRAPLALVGDVGFEDGDQLVIRVANFVETLLAGEIFQR
jgi:hypothetical protein